MWLNFRGPLNQALLCTNLTMNCTDTTICKIMNVPWTEQKTDDVVKHRSDLLNKHWDKYTRFILWLKHHWPQQQKTPHVFLLPCSSIYLFSCHNYYICITLYDTSASLSAAESVRIIYCYMYCDTEVKSDTNNGSRSVYSGNVRMWSCC